MLAVTYIHTANDFLLTVMYNTLTYMPTIIAFLLTFSSIVMPISLLVLCARTGISVISLLVVLVVKHDLMVDMQ